MAGSITHPAIRWSYALGGSEHELFSIPRRPSADMRAPAAGRQAPGADLLLAEGGCIVRYAPDGTVVWKSRSYGINAIAAIADLDGDGVPEIAASSGYEVFVLSSRDGALLMRDFVGFPASAGAPANTILCHRFDPASPGMQMAVPLMSAKEVRVYDFRRGCAHALPPRVLWMDDAYHPTIAAADLDGDGIDELIVSKLCGLYVFDALGGTMKSSVRWLSNGERHRNYGLLQFHDIDGDGALEVIIAADRVARHITVVDNDGRGNLSLLWDRFVEFIYPNDTTELRHTWNSVRDLDGDGQLEIVLALFNARGDNRWWLEVIDPRTGALKGELPDRYLWGVQDADGDGTAELIVSAERARQVSPFSECEIISFTGGSWQTLWSGSQLHPAGRDLRPAGRISEFRPALFGHNETWTAPYPGGGVSLLFFTAPPGADPTETSLLELHLAGKKSETRTTRLSHAPGVLVAEIADLDGDGQPERVLSDASGTIRIIGADGSPRTSFQTGFRLPLEGFSIARPAATPVVYGPEATEGPPGRAKPWIVLPDNANIMHQIRESADSTSAETVRKIPGRGCVGYDQSFHSPYVGYLGGTPCLFVAETSNPQGSVLHAYAPDGTERGSWTIPGAPPVLPLRIGLYNWQLLPLDGREQIVAAYFASYSMNSEQSVCIDIDGRQLWHLTQYGEGEWGRGMGPWSAYSSIMRRADADAGAASRAPQASLFFLAKDTLCEVDPQTGRWRHEPWLLWHATTVALGQPDWEFTKERLPLFGTAKDPFTAYGSVILADLDGDGREEMVIGGCFGGMGVLRSDHTVLWWRSTPFTDVMLRHPGVADLRGDGRLCVGVCHADGRFVCHDGSTGKELWTISLKSTTSDIVSCDIDGDGREEFIMGTTDGRLLAIGASTDGEGEIRWSLDLGSSVGTPTIADVCGDGRPEVLAVAGDGSLYCVAQAQDA